MISTELYIQTVNVFDNGVNYAFTGPTIITDTAKNWITNQWKDYYVRIVSGTGVGQEALDKLLC